MLLAVLDELKTGTKTWEEQIWYLPSQDPGARLTDDFLPMIQIKWKLRLALILLLAIGSQQIFAHATTAQLLCHEQNFVVITVLESSW